MLKFEALPRLEYRVTIVKELFNEVIKTWCMASNTDFASAHRLTKIIPVSQICHFGGIDEVIRLFIVKQNVASLHFP